MNVTQLLFLLTLPIVAVCVLVYSFAFTVVIWLREYRKMMEYYWQYYHKLGGNC